MGLLATAEGGSLTCFAGEALECHCGGQKFCSRPVETCSSSNDVCSTLVITSGPGKSRLASL